MKRVMLKLSGEALAGEKRPVLMKKQYVVWHCR